MMVAALMALMGCGGGDAPFKALSLGEVPDALTKGFAKADAALKMQVEMVANQVRANQLAPASLALNDLVAIPSLKPEQRTLLSQAQMAVNQEIRAISEPQQAAGGGAAAPVKRAVNVDGTPAPAANPEEAAAAAAALRLYQQSK